jgi:1-acyl-sn-glycerol-3-phosphate acyltransferase
MASFDALVGGTPRSLRSFSGLAARGAREMGSRELRGVRRALGLALTTAQLVVEGRIEHDLPAPAIARRAQRTARTLLELHGVDVHSAGSVPAPPAILVSNHVSYLDPLVFASVAPCLAIAKGETQGWPLLGPGLRALGVVFVRRGDPHSGAIALRQACRALDCGAMVLNFPEGTTSDGRAVARFQRGIFGLARIARVSVVPACVSYDDDRIAWFGGQAFAPHYWRLSRAARTVVRVVFGEPITVNESDDPGIIAARARTVVTSLRRPRREV